MRTSGELKQIHPRDSSEKSCASIAATRAQNHTSCVSVHGDVNGAGNQPLLLLERDSVLIESG